MIFYILRRVGISVLSLVGIYTSVFLVVNTMSVDPARALLGPNAREEEVASLRKQYGLDLPILQRYLQSLYRLKNGNLGESFFYHMPVVELIVNSSVMTLLIIFVTLTSSFFLSILLAVFLVLRSQTFFSRFLMEVLIWIQAVPPYIWCLLVLWFAGSYFRVTPLSNSGLYTVLLVFFSSIFPTFNSTLILHEKLRELNRQISFIYFARAMGFPEVRIWLMASKEIIPSIIAFVINSFGYILTSALFGEYIFNLPGLGKILIQSASRGDLQVIIGGTMLLALLFIILQLFSDILLMILDPRLRNLG